MNTNCPMKGRMCQCSDTEKCIHREDWKTEFREYFDKTLKPKKPTMINLDRELCINFIQQEIERAFKEGYGKGYEQKVDVEFERRSFSDKAPLTKYPS